MATHELLGVTAACPYTGRQFTNVGLEQLRRALCIFATERAWTEHHTPRNLLLALVKKVGELSGIFQWRGELPCGLASSLPQDEQQRLAQALSDVLLYLLRLADVCGVDLGRAALQKLADNGAKYPKQQQQSGPPNVQSDGSASSTASSGSTNMSILLQQQQSQRVPVSSLSSGLLHLQQQQQQQQQQHRLSPIREAPLSSIDAASPGSAQQQQPSAAGFIRSLPAASRQQQHLLQPAGLHCVSPNLAEGIIGYERFSRSPSPVAAAAAAMGSPGPSRLGSPGQLSPRSMANMLQSATAAMSPVSSQMPAQPQAQRQQQQIELEGFLGVPVSTDSNSSSRFAAISSSSSKVPADGDELLHSSKAAGLLPQGLLDEIGHCLQPNPGRSSDEDSDGAECSTGGGGSGVHHARVVSIGDCITPPLDFSPCMSRNNLTAAPLTPPGAGASRPGSLSNSSSDGSSNSSTNAAAVAAVSAAAAAASAAASGSAAASLWLTAAAAAAGRDAGPSALSGALTSQQDTATTLTSCGTSQHSWGIFSASSAEQSGAASSHGNESELESERSSTPPARCSRTTSSSACIVPEHNMQQPTLLGGARTGSSGLSPALGFAGLMHSPQQQHLQQREQQMNFGSASSGSIGGIPVRSLAAAAAAAAAASGIAPVDVDAASAVQQLAAGMLPIDGGGFELCPCCGRLHSGGCDTARKAKCLRCYRKAHLGKCWSRCISCNLVHAPGKCRAGSSSSLVNRGRRDQQQPVQPQQQRNTAAAAADEDLESFPSLSEGMAGSAPAAPAAAAAQQAPTNSQLDFSPSIGR